METFLQALARKGIKDPKIRSVKSHWTAQTKKRADSRQFPAGYGSANRPMIETVEPDGTVRIDYPEDSIYPKERVDKYVRRFCELNHLKG